MHIEKDLHLVLFVRVLHMNSKSVLRIGKSKSLYKEKVDMIVSGTCKSIMPVSITYKRDNLIGYYKIEGFKRLSHYKELTSEALLTFLELFFYALEDCGQFLIFPEEFVINTETVCVDDAFKKVKFLYICDCEKNKSRNKIKYFIKELGKLTTAEGKTYLDMLEKLVEIENVSYKKVRLFIEKLKLDAKKHHCL